MSALHTHARAIPLAATHAASAHWPQRPGGACPQAHSFVMRQEKDAARAGGLHPLKQPTPREAVSLDQWGARLVPLHSPQDRTPLRSEARVAPPHAPSSSPPQAQASLQPEPPLTASQPRDPGPACSTRAAPLSPVLGARPAGSKGPHPRPEGRVAADDELGRASPPLSRLGPAHGKDGILRTSAFIGGPGQQRAS